MIFETEEFGRIEVKPRSVEYPNGYVYFFRDDCETSFLDSTSDFYDMWNRRFTVSISKGGSVSVLEI